MDSMKWNKRLIFACIFISPRKGTYNNGPRPFPANEKCQSVNLFCPSASFSEESPRFEINLGMLIANTNEPLQKLSEKAMDKYMDIDKHKDSTVASSAIFVTNFGMYP